MQLDYVLTEKRGTNHVVISLLLALQFIGVVVSLSKFEYRRSVRYERLLVNASYVTGSRQMRLSRTPRLEIDSTKAEPVFVWISNDDVLSLIGHMGLGLLPVFSQLAL